MDVDLAVAAERYLHNAAVSPAQLRERLAVHGRDPEFGSDLEALTPSPYQGFELAEPTRELIQWTDAHLEGNLSRCLHWYNEDESCPLHG